MSDQASSTTASKGQFLFLLLSSIDDDLTLSKICEKTGKTKQALNYHLRQSERHKLVFKEQAYPFAIYRLTSLGKRVKEDLRQSEHPTPTWNCHNLIVGFDIKSMGSFNFVETPRRKICEMRGGWKYAAEETGGHVVNVQDTGLLKIYCKERYAKDPDLAWAEMYSEAMRISQFYVERYGMRLQPMRIIRKGEKSLVKSEVMAKILGRFKTEGVYVNASKGPEELEERQDVYYVENLLKLPEKVSQLEQHLVNQARMLDRQSVVLERYTQQIELHLEVEDRTLAKLDQDLQIQQQTKDALIGIQEAVKKSQDVREDSIKYVFNGYVIGERSYDWTTFKLIRSGSQNIILRYPGTIGISKCILEDLQSHGTKIIIVMVNGRARYRTTPEKWLANGIRASLCDGQELHCFMKIENFDIKQPDGSWAKRGIEQENEIIQDGNHQLTRYLEAS